MSAATSPFKFLDSYQREDLDIFFGRERETEDLYDALSGVKHLLVYGPSGSGKTSLIECGLRNRFSDADWYALSIRRGANMTASVFARINEALRRKIQLDPDTKLPTDSDIDFGQVVELLFDERYKPVYLLFDQFEELLISGEDSERRDFFARLDRLIRYKVPCRVLLVMREEFIGHLSEFEPLCPSIFQHRFRLEKMGRAGVHEVIEKILAAPHYSAFFTASAPEALAGKILTKLPDQQREIELTHVQVFLSELWDRAQESQASALPELHAGLVREEDNLEGVLNGFLRNQLRELDAAYGQNTALEVLAAMISERHTKLQVDEVALAAALEKNNITLARSLPELLRDLERRRILRTLKSGEQTQYEISHDVLARVVGQNLTEEMKLRERAREVYRVYGERKGLFSREDLDYLRPFETYLAMPEGLKGRMEESENLIFERLEAEKVEIEQRAKEAEAQVEREGKLRRKAQIEKRRATFAAFVICGLAIWALLQNVELSKTESELNVSLTKEKAAKDTAELRRIEAVKVQEELAISLEVAKEAKNIAEIRRIEAELAEHKATMLLEASRYLAAKKLPDNFDVFFYNDTLNFSGWDLEILPAEVGKLQNLKSLDLSNNNLRTLPVEIGKLQNLQSLDLENNRFLDSLPAEIGNLKKLQSLDLTHANSVPLPAWIAKLQNLRTLSLQGYSFFEFPPEIGKLQNLQSLNLSWNGVLHEFILSAEVGKLQNLKFLNLSWNNIDSLPAEIGNLQQLRYLDLSNNKLRRLPAEIGNLKNLDSLDLDGNEFRGSIPAEIIKLKNLQSLDMGGNWLDSLSTEIGDLQNLQVLDLNGIFLKSLPTETLIQMPKLKRLVLAEFNRRCSIELKYIEALRSAMPWCEILCKGW